MNFLRLSSALLTLLLFFAACTKIERTEMGGDLIPPVDNVFTFDTILQVVANNYLPDDSTRINQGADHLAGGISNDPLFGSSRATMFFEMKPSFYPFEFTDSATRFDSAVLVLRYSGYYGDSVSPVQFDLYEVDRIMIPDTSFTPSYTIHPDIGINRSRLWGQKTMQANRYRDTVDIKRGDSIYRRVNNELRIPLNATLAAALFNGDSARVFGSDSIFKSFLPGFALESRGNPNALHYFRLGEGSEIQFYYLAKNGAKFDTVQRNFGVQFNSAHAVKLERDRSGAELNNFLTQNPSTGVTQLYVDGTPGAMVSVQVPGLKTLSNRVLHRVELRAVELAPNNGSLSYLSAPRLLYLDAEYENEPGVFRGIPYDLSPFSRYYCFPSGGIDFSFFGGTPATRLVDGLPHTEYNFNITRYVQSVITRSEPYFNFRISIPYYVVYRDCVSPASSFPPNVFPIQSSGSFINRIGESRVRLAGGNHPDTRLRMQVRIIYSRL
ncbi:MAG TPA: DUF4270 family protein [Phnomibacter sp.]|nr:DUF4270 family protein [Phnomibacter sp.]